MRLHKTAALRIIIRAKIVPVCARAEIGIRSSAKLIMIYAVCNIDAGRMGCNQKLPSSNNLTQLIPIGSIVNLVELSLPRVCQRLGPCYSLRQIWSTLFVRHNEA